MCSFLIPYLFLLFLLNDYFDWPRIKEVFEVKYKWEMQWSDLIRCIFNWNSQSRVSIDSVLFREFKLRKGRGKRIYFSIELSFFSVKRIMRSFWSSKFTYSACTLNWIELWSCLRFCHDISTIFTFDDYFGGQSTFIL